MASTTEEKTTASASDVATVLEDKAMFVKELLTLVPVLALAKAWAAGEVEFGRRSYSVTGPVDKPGSRMVVEQGVNWSGAKAGSRNKPLRELLAEDEKLPKCAEYALYNQIPKTSEQKSPLTKLEEPEAHALIALQVRLTDKGLSSIGIV